jgi:hypothetical protein
MYSFVDHCFSFVLFLLSTFSKVHFKKKDFIIVIKRFIGNNKNSSIGQQNMMYA